MWYCVIKYGKNNSISFDFNNIREMLEYTYSYLRGNILEDKIYDIHIFYCEDDED